MNFDRIFLTGFMTSGKSTLGPILANVLGWNFYDLDHVIEEKENNTVVEIFNQKGEKYFRQKEREILELLIKEKCIIISLGGGTIADEVNLKLLKESGKIIYLEVSAEVLYNRLKHKLDRPLFRDLVLKENSKEDFIERINELLEKREKYYRQADLVINCDSRKLGLTVDELAKKLQRL